MAALKQQGDEKDSDSPLNPVQTEHLREHALF